MNAGVYTAVVGYQGRGQLSYASITRLSSLFILVLSGVLCGLDVQRLAHSFVFGMDYCIHNIMTRAEFCAADGQSLSYLYTTTHDDELLLGGCFDSFPRIEHCSSPFFGRHAI
jgi:hypothetical protein